MPIFDDRFASHSSPSFGSGPVCSLLKSIREHQDRSMMRRSSHLRSLSSLRVGGRHPNTRITFKTTPWSVFQDGSLVTITPSILADARSSSLADSDFHGHRPAVKMY
ncbi:hypothetical protein Trco_006544 [Trichoderma cornu-damae]|uniref:Uncharacterized protein n=1 Tax=Trichoderma cornu-damae TaxID=654480 RepID=A0A9P8TU89_9HYPO|nr:hypothetical protein Trco_006544 [Trichoderma cornu-damae]